MKKSVNESKIPARTVERLAMYRRLLSGMLESGCETIFSHELASFANNTAPQVRRDLMAIGFSGRPRCGYRVGEMLACIERVLGGGFGRRIALFGVGNLGRALLSHFAYQRGLTVVAAFDTDESKLGRVISGCRCYHLDDLPERVSVDGISLGIIAVPGSAAQDVADAAAAAGIRGLLNFAPVPLRVDQSVFLEHIDITAALEKVAYFASSK